MTAPPTLGYARVSREEQARDGLSLPDQRQAIERYCALRELGVPLVLADEGISGTRLPGRPEAQRLVSMVRAGQVQHVVATALDRLFRSTVDAVTFFQLAQERGVSVHLIREAVDTTTPTGQFICTLMAALAQLESQRSGARIRHVLAYKREQAGGRQINGRAPYGWRWAPINGDPSGPKTLRQDAAEQSVIARMAAWRADGATIADVVRRLNATARPRRRETWHREQVRRILTRYDRSTP